MRPGERPRRMEFLLHHEEQEDRDEEGENAETFRERRADEGPAELRIRSCRGCEARQRGKLPKIKPTPMAAAPIPMAARPAPIYFAATGSI